MVRGRSRQRYDDEVVEEEYSHSFSQKTEGDSYYRSNSNTYADQSEVTDYEAREDDGNKRDYDEEGEEDYADTDYEDFDEEEMYMEEDVSPPSVARSVISAGNNSSGVMSSYLSQADPMDRSNSDNDGQESLMGSVLDSILGSINTDYMKNKVMTMSRTGRSRSERPEQVVVDTAEGEKYDDPNPDEDHYNESMLDIDYRNEAERIDDDDEVEDGQSSNDDIQEEISTEEVGEKDLEDGVESTYEEYYSTLNEKSNNIVKKTTQLNDLLSDTPAENEVNIPSLAAEVAPPVATRRQSSQNSFAQARGRSRSSNRQASSSPTRAKEGLGGAQSRSRSLMKGRSRSRSITGFFRRRSSSRAPPEASDEKAKGQVSSKNNNSNGLGTKTEDTPIVTSASTEDRSVLEDGDNSAVNYTIPNVEVPSQPKQGKGAFGKTKRGKNISKRDLVLRQEAENYLQKEQYKTLADLVQRNPKVLEIQAEQPYNQTFLHVIANQCTAPPENFILKMLSHNTALASVTDSNGNTPLHCAAQTACSRNMQAFVIFLKFHPVGATLQNHDGNLPLHIAASNALRGSDNCVHLLLESHSQGISTPNNRGQIPLHVAMTTGSKNLKNVQHLVRMHKFRKSSVSVLDNQGYSPLHSAIINDTKYESIVVFNKEARDTFLSAFLQESEDGFLPLHTALMKKQIDQRILLSLIETAPYTGNMPTPAGEMPVKLATKRKLNTDVVKALLASDLPIELGNKKGGVTGMGSIIEKEHGNSWWHVAVECRGEYVDMIGSLLGDYATFVQVVALARSVGPDNTTMTIQAASPSLEAVFTNLLRFYYRYEISTNKMPVCNNSIQMFPAVDRGQELEKQSVVNPWLSNGFTTIQGNMKRVHTQTATNDCHEVSLSTFQSEKKEVTLKCFAFSDPFQDELAVRKNHKLSGDYVEEIITVHKGSNYVNASFTTGKLLCIAFERNDTTLRELVDTSDRSGSNWLVKCHLVLKDIANALDHVHSQCLIHGNLDMSSVGEFGTKWKLMGIGSVAAMGTAMGGYAGRYSPPEAIASHIMKDEKLLKNIKNQPGNNKRLTKGLNPALPPLPKSIENKKSRKKFGIFFFNMNDMGFGNRSNLASLEKKKKDTSIRSFKSSNNSVASGLSTNSDEGSQRIIAMQEDEIARLRDALQEKEHIYRRQIAEERAVFKKQEIERQRQLQRLQTSKQKNVKASLPRLVPEKVMASPHWDVWAFGLIMAELLIGKNLILPCCADTEEDFLISLSGFGELQVAAVREEVRERAGDLAADLVARMLHPNPSQRIGSVSKILQHKYFHEEVVTTTSSTKKTKSWHGRRKKK